MPPSVGVVDLHLDARNWSAGIETALKAVLKAITAKGDDEVYDGNISALDHLGAYQGVLGTLAKGRALELTTPTKKRGDRGTSRLRCSVSNPYRLLRIMGAVPAEATDMIRSFLTKHDLIAGMPADLTHRPPACAPLSIAMLTTIKEKLITVGHGNGAVLPLPTDARASAINIVLQTILS